MPRQKIDHWEFELVGKSNKIDVTREYEGFIDKEVLGTHNNKDIYQLKKPKVLTDEFNYLKITNRKNKYWRPITIKKGTPFSLFLGNLSFKSIEIDIVYFLNTKISPQYKNLFRDQLKQLIKSRILNTTKCKLHIICIRNSENQENLIKDVMKSLELYKICETNLIFKNDDHMEYEGIKKVWELSKSEDNRLIFYFHGKGLSYMKNKFFYIRQPLEKLIFKLLIDEWKQNLETIQRFDSIDKVGILSGGNGFLWFNFWIAKSSYIKGLEKPIKTKRACYYEDWLGRTLIRNKKVKKEEICDRNFLYTIDKTYSILNNPKKYKYNLGTTCKVERGGFVGLGLSRYTYKIWFLFYKYVNKILIRK